MLPSILGGAVVPLVVYFVAHRHMSTTHALMLAGAFPAAWVALQWIRTRRIDPIGLITLFGFVVGVTASELLGGNAFVLKVRDSAFTALFGIACFISLRTRRPMMFYIGRAMSAGEDDRKVAAYDELWEIPEAQRVFRVITTTWGFGLLVEAGVRVLLAIALPTGAFLAVAPVWAAIAFGGLFAFTVAYSRRARADGEAELTAQGLAFPSVPVD
jgi:hypothetical protein